MKKIKRINICLIVFLCVVVAYSGVISYVHFVPEKENSFSNEISGNQSLDNTQTSQENSETVKEPVFNDKGEVIIKDAGLDKSEKAVFEITNNELKEKDYPKAIYHGQFKENEETNVYSYSVKGEEFNLFGFENEELVVNSFENADNEEQITHISHMAFNKFTKEEFSADIVNKCIEKYTALLKVKAEDFDIIVLNQENDKVNFVDEITEDIVNDLYNETVYISVKYRSTDESFKSATASLTFGEGFFSVNLLVAYTNSIEFF